MHAFVELREIPGSLKIHHFWPHGWVEGYVVSHHVESLGLQDEHPFAISIIEEVEGVGCGHLLVINSIVIKAYIGNDFSTLAHD